MILILMLKRSNILANFSTIQQVGSGVCERELTFCKRVPKKEAEDIYSLVKFLACGT